MIKPYVIDIRYRYTLLLVLEIGFIILNVTVFVKECWVYKMDT